MRFAMRLDRWWLPALALIGAIPRTSYVAVDDDVVRVRFGLFRYRLARARIVGARRVRGEWWYGIGVHTNLVDTLIVNGSLGGLVELRLAPPKLVWLLVIPVRCTRYYVSLADPDAFLQALGQGAPVPAG